MERLPIGDEFKNHSIVPMSSQEALNFIEGQTSRVQRRKRFLQREHMRRKCVYVVILIKRDVIGTRSPKAVKKWIYDHQNRTNRIIRYYIGRNSSGLNISPYHTKTPRQSTIAKYVRSGFRAFEAKIIKTPYNDVQQRLESMVIVSSLHLAY